MWGDYYFWGFYSPTPWHERHDKAPVKLNLNLAHRPKAAPPKRHRTYNWH